MLLSEKVHTIQVIVLNLIVIALQACTPFVIYRLTQLIDETSSEANLTSIDNSEVAFNTEYSAFYASIFAFGAQLFKISKIGLVWALVLFTVQNLSCVLEMHRITQQQLLLVRVCTSARLMIQKKMLSVSPATNRLVSDADVRKIFCRDLYEIQHALWCVTDKVRLPFWMVLSIFWLFYSLDIYSALCFLSLIALQAFANFKFQEFAFKRHKEAEENDKKAREEVTQTLKNVKFLKQYGWKDLFMNRITEAFDTKLDFNKYTGFLCRSNGFI